MEEFKLNKFNNEELEQGFPVKVANEVFRIKQRIRVIPSDINGITQISKSITRLEDELKQLGYEMPELLNLVYDEGMMVHARFIPVDSLKKGEKHITKVIKPAIIFKGELVQVAEIEVSIGD